MNRGLDEDEDVDPHEVVAREGVCWSALVVFDPHLFADEVGVEIRIFVRIPPSLIVMISPDSMLCGTFTRKCFRCDGTGFDPEDAFSSEATVCCCGRIVSFSTVDAASSAV